MTVMGILWISVLQTSDAIFMVTVPDWVNVSALKLSEESTVLSAPSKVQDIDLMSPLDVNFKSFSVITAFSQKIFGVSI